MKKLVSTFILVAILGMTYSFYNNFQSSELPKIHKPVTHKNPFASGAQLCNFMLGMRALGVMKFTDEELVLSPISVVVRYPDYFQIPTLVYGPIENNTIIRLDTASNTK